MALWPIGKNDIGDACRPYWGVCVTCQVIINQCGSTLRIDENVVGSDVQVHDPSGMDAVKCFFKRVPLYGCAFFRMRERGSLNVLVSNDMMFAHAECVNDFRDSGDADDAFEGLHLSRPRYCRDNALERYLITIFHRVQHNGFRFIIPGRNPYEIVGFIPSLPDC